MALHAVQLEARAETVINVEAASFEEAEALARKYYTPQNVAASRVGIMFEYGDWDDVDVLIAMDDDRAAQVRATNPIINDVVEAIRTARVEIINPDSLEHYDTHFKFFQGDDQIAHGVIGHIYDPIKKQYIPSRRAWASQGTLMADCPATSGLLCDEIDEIVQALNCKPRDNNAVDCLKRHGLES